MVYLLSDHEWEILQTVAEETLPRMSVILQTNVAATMGTLQFNHTIQNMAQMKTIISMLQYIGELEEGESAERAVEVNKTKCFKKKIEKNESDDLLFTLRFFLEQYNLKNEELRAHGKLKGRKRWL